MSTPPRVSVNGASDAKPVDQVFAEPQRTTDFKFDARTANVFDDMVSRSVPFYDEMQRMTTELVADFATPGSNVYDIGCATGTTLLACESTVNPSVNFVGMDNSQEMLDKAKIKMDLMPSTRKRTLECVDLHDSFTIENASVVILTLTLQFVRPLHRERVMRTIADGMNPQGALILIEKLTEENTMFNRLFIKYYYEMKRRHGYSELEISQKREALENVLIPYHYTENERLARHVGFTQFIPFFRWYNFCGMIAVK